MHIKNKPDERNFLFLIYKMARIENTKLYKCYLLHVASEELMYRQVGICKLLRIRLILYGYQPIYNTNIKAKYLQFHNISGEQEKALLKNANLS